MKILRIFDSFFFVKKKFNNQKFQRISPEYYSLGWREKMYQKIFQKKFHKNERGHVKKIKNENFGNFWPFFWSKKIVTENLSSQVHNTFPLCRGKWRQKKLYKNENRFMKNKTLETNIKLRVWVYNNNPWFEQKQENERTFSHY